MSIDLSHLTNLARLTKENSEDGRRELLREVTDLFMQDPEAHSEREIAYFGEIMNGIVGQVETMVRQHLSETISRVPNAPSDLVVALANDEIEVAMPVLTYSEALGDEDLVKIVEKQSQEHLRAISKRRVVTETVTDALVKKGDDTVLGTLAENMGARFSETGYETIVDRAKQNEDLNAKLMARKDVPETLSNDMFWRVSWAMREQILDEDGSLTDGQMDVIMKNASEWFEEQMALKKLDPAESFIARKEKLGQLDENMLLELIRKDEMPEFVAGLSHLAKIENETARQAVFEASGERLTIICKALDIHYDIFGEFLYLTNFDGKRAPEDIDALLNVYKDITPQVAQKALRFLRTRMSVQKRA